MMAKRAIYSAIGLDMTSDRIRLLQLKWQGESLSIHAASQAQLFPKAEITDGQGEKGLPDFCMVLRELLSKGKFKGKQVMAALPNHLVTTIPIKFTLKEGEGIDQAILREANNYLSFPQEQGGTVSSWFVIDYLDYLDIPPSDQRSQPSDQRSQQTGQRRNAISQKQQDAASTIKAQQMSALLIAAHASDVSRYLNLLKNAGLSLSVIEPRYCSLFRTIQWAQQGEPLRDQFIFSMEENDTLLMALVDEQILIVRTLSWGINAIKAKLEKALGLSGTVADLVLQKYGVDDLWRSSQQGGVSSPGKSSRLKKGTGKEGMSSRISHNPDRQSNGVFLSEGNLCQVIYEVLSPVLEDFCQEIQKVLSYCVSMVQQRVIDRGFLLGEGARIKYLDHFIQQRTGIGITAWPPATLGGRGGRGDGGRGRGEDMSLSPSPPVPQSPCSTRERGGRGEFERPLEDGLSIIKDLAEDYPFFEVALGLALRGTKAGIRDWGTRGLGDTGELWGHRELWGHHT